jgi:hypothetical protein
VAENVTHVFKLFHPPIDWKVFEVVCSEIAVASVVTVKGTYYHNVV